MDFYHGAHQPIGDLKVLENIQYVHLLVHSLWVTDVPDMHQQILEVQKRQVPGQQLHFKRVTLKFWRSDKAGTSRRCVLSV